MSRWLKLSLAAIAVALLVAVVTWRYLQYQIDAFIEQPVQLAKPELVTIAPGSSIYALLRQWQADGWIGNRHYLRWLLWQQPRWSQLQAGSFELKPGWSLGQTLEHLISGPEHQFSITFVEGSQWREWRKSLQQAPALSQQEGLNSEAGLLELLALDSAKLEGWLYPDTYFYTAGTPATEIIKRSHHRMQTLLNQAWRQRDARVDRHLSSPYEALILASIIEKETGQAAERSRIASVFHNRFNKKMRLQTDPTVIYGMGERFNGNITKADLREKTPYNTYVIKGLPPTPIAMPGLAAIQAALQPEQTDYYFFVSRGDGSHVFASTLKEHNANVRKYILKQE